ncbi:MAG: hypothetical protein L6R38_006289 [Xanthoria sp. 2 TBL-2021]|nr:MAG: hypothetical protein L6R38_006289 [Xanthoria sp. 2 TBL-2021]
MGVTNSEFPLLNAAGLYVVDTAGNGNCLFHALSDQLYGDQSQHGGIREATIQYMRANGDYYKSFVEAHPGGGTRRNPKRKNAGAFASKFNNQAASPAELDAAFESHLSRMAKGGTYGDNMEVVAFSKAYNVDLIIYKREHALCVKVDETSAAPRMLHIAYHTYEHYSSVRNVRGPHTGIPNTEPIYESVEAATEAKEQLAKGPYIAPWMIDAVITSQPYLSDRMIIQKKLENASGSVDAVVSNLIDAQQASSSPSSEYGSSSIEREQDSEDEEVVGPKKKQDRRLSRASRAAAKEKEEQRKHALTVRMKDRQLPSTKESASPPVISVDDVKLHDSDETEEEDWRNESSYKDSESASVSTSASDYSASSKLPSGGVRLKLSQPKKVEDRLQPPAKGNQQRIIATAEHTPLPFNTLNPAKMAPRRRRLFRRDELDMKKAAQKANAKDRKKATAALARAPDNVRSYHQGFKEHTPAVEARIKVLCI